MLYTKRSERPARLGFGCLSALLATTLVVTCALMTRFQRSDRTIRGAEAALEMRDRRRLPTNVLDDVFTNELSSADEDNDHVLFGSFVPRNTSTWVLLIGLGALGALAQITVLVLAFVYMEDYGSLLSTTVGIIVLFALLLVVSGTMQTWAEKKKETTNEEWQSFALGMSGLTGAMQIFSLLKVPTVHADDAVPESGNAREGPLDHLIEHALVFESCYWGCFAALAYFTLFYLLIPTSADMSVGKRFLIGFSSAIIFGGCTGTFFTFLTMDPSTNPASAAMEVGTKDLVLGITGPIAIVFILALAYFKCRGRWCYA